ncbi:unnamed protein product [Vitrella brassicaformis CCMP3155]|uniref:Uncharacterized protein n=1 Tax=Vitrella brassicaformis (strain CCMP3155) TaxID=1169540 RepID=A0A0G4EM28_VITBC|nr:unnamed protein product [Vitrella brassicaformis CCMP3155]|eukprot:CEL97898.1 unnamed protein product [Vitrella brassicaformis CCMP3155]
MREPAALGTGDDDPVPLEMDSPSPYAVSVVSVESGVCESRLDLEQKVGLESTVSAETVGSLDKAQWGFYVLQVGSLTFWLVDRPFVYCTHGWVIPLFSVYWLLGAIYASPALPAWLSAVILAFVPAVWLTTLVVKQLPPRSRIVMPALTIMFIYSGLCVAAPYFSPFGAFNTFLWMVGAALFFAHMFAHVAVPRAYPVPPPAASDSSAPSSRHTSRWFRVQPSANASQYSLPAYEASALFQFVRRAVYQNPWLTHCPQVNAVAVERLVRFAGWAIMGIDFVSDLALGLEFMARGLIGVGIVIIACAMPDAVTQNTQYYMRPLETLTVRQSLLVFGLAVIEVPIVVLALVYGPGGDTALYAISAALASAMVLVRGGLLTARLLEVHRGDGEKKGPTARG